MPHPHTSLAQPSPVPPCPPNKPQPVPSPLQHTTLISSIPSIPALSLFFLIFLPPIYLYSIFCIYLTLILYFISLLYYCIICYFTILPYDTYMYTLTTNSDSAPLIFQPRSPGACLLPPMPITAVIQSAMSTLSTILSPVSTFYLLHMVRHNKGA